MNTATRENPHQDRVNRSSVQPARLSGWWIPLAWAPVLLIASQLHTVFNEWGGVMQWFAGQDILHGIGYRGWTAHFWPPLFSLLMGLGSPLASGFLLGKLISISASVLLLHTAYRLALSLSGSASVALWTQVFLLVNPLYFVESITAHNHMLDALFFVTGLHLFLLALRHPVSNRPWIAGLVCGLASLARTTSAVLALAALVPFVQQRDRRLAAGLSARFLGGFFLVTSPWLILNGVYNGSPVANWQHLNVTAGVLDPANAGTNLALWRANADGSIQSVHRLILQHPLAYARNVVRNIVACIERTIRFQASVAPFVLPGILDALMSAAPGPWRAMLGVFLMYTLMVSQAHVANWYLLPWIVPITVLAVRLLRSYAERAEQSFPWWRRLQLSSVALALLVLYGARSTTWELRRLVREDASYRPLVESREVGEAMRAHDAQIHDKIIMAIDPGRAYYAGGKYVMTPLEYAGSATGLVSYEGLGPRVAAYAPRYPAVPRDLRADYLVFTRTEANTPPGALQEPRGFDFLLDPSSEKVPQPFVAIYRSQNVVVYEILRTR